jgi:Fe-S-cluster formation regulator IscX/YfhJ
MSLGIQVQVQHKDELYNVKFKYDDQLKRWVVTNTNFDDASDKSDEEYAELIDAARKQLADAIEAFKTIQGVQLKSNEDKAPWCVKRHVHNTKNRLE